MKGIVADNVEEHRSGRALVASLRHIPPTSPGNLMFLMATANSGEFSCEARETLNLPNCKPTQFVHTKAGIAVLTIVCVLVALGAAFSFCSTPAQPIVCTTVSTLQSNI